MSETAVEVVSGRLPALACLSAGKREVYKASLYKNAKGLEEILGYLQPGQITWADKHELERLASGARHQGVVLQVSPLPVLSTREWLARHGERECVLLVLDSITDPMNFGAIIRSAAAFGAGGVLFQKDRAAPVTPVVVKAAAGGIEYVDLIQATNLVRDIQQLKKESFWVAALDADAPQTLWQSDLKGRIALIIGSEGEGIRRLVREQADFMVSIPIRGEMGSLNASVSAGIALSEWCRQSCGGRE